MSRAAETLQGLLKVEPVRAGTGSAHTAAVLYTDGGERLLLVRLRGHPFEDPEAQALAGRRVQAHGFRLGGELRFDRLEPLP